MRNNQDAISELIHFVHHSDSLTEAPSNESCLLAIKALQEQAQREKGCAVNHPAHYNTGDIECIDAIQAATTGLSGFEGYCIGCAIKYLWRWKRKGGVEDLKKAEWYIAKLTGECEHSGAQKTAKIIGNIHDGKDGQHDKLRVHYSDEIF